MSTAADPNAILARLSPDDRDLLTALAIAPYPVARSDWEGRVHRLTARVVGGRLVAGPPIREAVGRFETAGVTVRVPNRDGWYVAPAELVGLLLDDAAARGRLVEIAKPQLTSGVTPAWAAGAAEEKLRVGLALDDAELLARALHPYAWGAPREQGMRLVVAMTAWPSATWIARLPEPHRARYLQAILETATTLLARVSPEVLDAASQSEDAEVKARAAILRALSGDIERARALLSPESTAAWPSGACGVVATVEGRWGDALDAFDRSAMTKKGTRKVRAMPSILAVFDLLLATSPAGRPADAPGLPARVGVSSRSLSTWYSTARAFESLAAFRATGRDQHLSSVKEQATWVEALVCGLAARWMGRPPPPREPLVALIDRANRNGYGWVAEQLEGLASSSPNERALAGLTSNKTSWEIALDALSASVVASARASETARPRGEIWWVVEAIDVEYDGMILTPMLVTKPGQKGSVVSARRLTSDEALPLSDEDRPLAAAFANVRRDRYGSRRDGAHSLRTLLSAVGHPRLRDGLGNSLLVERGVAEVRVDATTNGARLTVTPKLFSESGVAVRQRPGRITVIEQTEEAKTLVAILGHEGLAVPAAGIGRAVETLAALGDRVAVSGLEAFGESVGARTESADPTIHVQIFRAGATFRARLRVVPGGSEGPALRPGVEPARVLVSGAKGARSLVRDLGIEKARTERLLERAPILASLGRDGDDRIAGDLESCLDLLVELEDVRGDDVVVDWPEGDALRTPIRRDSKALKVRVGSGKSAGGWLSLEAELALEEKRVLGFAELVERTSAARGRFVPLADGQYLALTAELRERIDALARARQLTDAKGRTSLAMLPAIAQWVDGADVELADVLRERLETLGKALDTTPRVPRALQAELRDYQREGFVFLARRASSGLGSCLADDMGLGKTVQALALLVARAKAGPSLVVAPTSVCRNWEDEGRKFAPTLTFHSLARASDRDACLAKLGESDVLLVSYGLLATSADLLAKRRFTTAVFDEAHALKNPTTRRAVAARSIVADAVVGLSGTPLENHLGELHSLFDLLAPGLLGTRDRFERAFAGPISRGEKRAAAQLRSLVRPFLLRRTKSQVMDELPEKTEVTRILAPSAAERAFYEALRRSAVARVRKIDKGKAAQARIMVLAEITKLRRAAVDPRLVGGDEAPAGAKLEALAELVSELRDEGHKALVFSQFLEVLDRSGEILAAREIRCVRLDGSMDPAARAKAVDAFQNGQADVFLLSLKAGGVGMNLTAADYVVHLDPWWNPAVEDQASDRAHRIGQTRPVTVVRLVTEGTIEEKVLAMHARKRAMYADAIGDLEVGKKLDLTALAELLDDADE